MEQRAYCVNLFVTKIPTPAKKALLHTYATPNTPQTLLKLPAQTLNLDLPPYSNDATQQYPHYLEVANNSKSCRIKY